jgi:hypothetical protein
MSGLFFVGVVVVHVDFVGVVVDDVVRYIPYMFLVEFVM